MFERRWTDLLAWTAPLLVVVIFAVTTRVPQLRIEVVLAGVLGLLLIGLVAARPIGSIQVLVVLAPLNLVALAVALRLGIPTGVTRQLSYWKELLVVGLLLGAVRRRVPEQRRRGGHDHGQGSGHGERHGFDRTDWLMLAFVGLGVVYLAIPQLLTEIGSAIPFGDRGTVFRSMVGPVIVLLVVRRLALSVDELNRVMRTVITMAIVLGVVAVFELLASDLWNRLAVDVLDVPRMRESLFNETTVGDDIRVYGDVAGREVVRLGGPFFESLGFSFALVGLVAIAADAVLQRTYRLASLALGLSAFALLATQTRSAIVGGLLAVAVAVVRPRAGLASNRRIQSVAALGIAIIVAVPLIVASGLADRLITGDPGSDESHETASEAAREIITEEPLGLGLGYGTSGQDLRLRTGQAAGAQPIEGTSVEPGQESGARGYIIAENQYYDIGVQIGVAGMVLFILGCLSAIAGLYRTSKSEERPIASAAGGAMAMFLGLALTYRYLQPLLSFAVSWPQFALVGAALGAADVAHRARSRDIPG